LSPVHVVCIDSTIQGYQLLGNCFIEETGKRSLPEHTHIFRAISQPEFVLSTYNVYAV